MNVVIVNCFEPYESRVDLLFNFFKNKGNNVKVITSDFCHIDKTLRKEVREGFTYLEAKPYYRNISLKRLDSHWDFAGKVVKALPDYKPDLVYALVPPNSLVKEISKYKKKNPKVKVVFDLIDLWPETLPAPRLAKDVLLAPWAKVRNDDLRNADYVVTECSLYRERLGKWLDMHKTKTVYLARKWRKVQIESHSKKDKVSLCYLGSINNIVDIHAIGSIIEELSCTKAVELHVIGYGEKHETLIQAAREKGANVIDHGQLYDVQKKQEVFNECDYGLNIMKASVCVGLTMKSVDYFESGLPIINNIKGDTWEFVETQGIGVNWTIGQGLKLPDIDKQHVRAFFEQKFTEEVFYKQMEEVYTACLV